MSNPAQDNDPISEVLEDVRLAMQLDKCVVIGKCASTGKEVSICYNAFGNPSDPCLLLVQGICTSLLGFPRSFIEGFVQKGYYVIRYDNRDIGKSTKFSEFPAPALIRYGLPAWASIGERVPYKLEDLAADGMGLLTALSIEKAHVFGMSMGGMIAQQMAIHYPGRVLSLNTHMTHAGGRAVVEPSIFSYLQFLKSPRSNSPEDRAEHMVGFVRFLGQMQYDRGDDMRRYFIETYKRDGDTGMTAMPRQVAALMRSPSRVEELKKVQVPALIIHGTLDPLIPVGNAFKLAEALPDSKIVIYPCLGHDFPPELHQSMVEEILLNMRKATKAPNNA